MAIFGIYSSHRAKFKSKIIFSPINSNAPAFFKVLELSRSEYIDIECILNIFLLSVHIVFFYRILEDFCLFWWHITCFEDDWHVQTSNKILLCIIRPLENWLWSIRSFVQRIHIHIHQRIWSLNLVARASPLAAAAASSLAAGSRRRRPLQVQGGRRPPALRRS